MRQCARDAVARRGLAGALLLFLDLAVSVPREWAQLLKGKPMSGIGRDLSYAVRILWRSPGFTIAAIVTLALGIGANTAIFSLADATLLRPLKVARVDQLYVLNWSTSYPDYTAFAARGDLFDGAAAASGGRVNMVADGDASLVEAGFVSGNYFGVLGVAPAAGRVFGPADDVRDGPLLGVLSYRWWQAHFGGDPEVIGRVLHANGQAVTIVGVAAEGFRGIRPSDTTAIYFPVTATPRIRTGFFSRPDMLSMAGMQWLNVIVRVKPGVAPAAAGAALDAVYRQTHQGESDSGRDEGFVLTPLRTRALGRDADSVSRFITLLGGVVALSLLIGCANLANLFLSRALVRRREIAVRLALGAGRARIARQVLVESVTLALAGGVAALAVAVAVLAALSRYKLPGGIAIDALDLRIDRVTLAFTAIAACATGILFGFAPAWRAASLDALDSMRTETRGGSGRSSLRSTLVGMQVALSLVLLAGTGLFVRSLAHALETPLGFRVDGVATASVNLGVARYNTARAEAFFEEALARVRRLPGVTAAAWTSLIPTNGARVFTSTVDGYQPRPGEEVAFYNAAVGPDYFRAAGTRLLRGRAFTEGDRRGTPLVGIINETAAAQYWSGRDPLGSRASDGDDHWITIVGVVEDARVRSLEEKPAPYMYLPFAQDAFGTAEPAHLFVRTDGDEDALLGPVGAALQGIDRSAPVYDVSTFAWRVRDLIMPQRMGAMLFACFSVLALALAAVGIYGVAAYAAVQRTREIGIRVALGASAVQIRRLVVARSLRPVLIGSVAGLALALWTAPFIRSFLVGLSARDPLTLAVVTVLVAFVAGIATWLPARHASKIAPVDALRTE
jgi:putative ABC transport system permease protein